MTQLHPVRQDPHTQDGLQAKGSLREGAVSDSGWEAWEVRTSRGMGSRVPKSHTLGRRLVRVSLPSHSQGLVDPSPVFQGAPGRNTPTPHTPGQHLNPLSL